MSWLLQQSRLNLQKSEENKPVNISGERCPFKLHLFLVLGLPLVLAVSSISIKGGPLVPGPDGSQMFALNAFDLYGLRFGRDIVNTFGPLGFLQFPLPLYGKLIPANLVFPGIVIITALAAAESLHATASKARSVAFFLCCYAALWICHGLTTDQSIMLAFFVCVTGSFLSDHQYRRIAMFATGAILSALILFIKFNTGVVCCTDLFIAVAAALLTRDRKLWMPAVVSLLVFVLSATVFSFFLFGSADGLYLYTKNTLAIASAYSQVDSSFNQAGLEIGAALLFMLLAFALGVYSLANKSKLVIPLAISGIPLFFAFKHAFIRATGSGHLMSFPFVALLMLGVSALFCKTKKECIGLAVIGVVLLVFLPMRLKQFKDEDFWSKQPLANGISSIKDMCNLTGLESRLTNDTRAGFQANKLPDSWLSRLKFAAEGVDCVPFNLYLCPANGLKWCASPVLQLYMAHNPQLDLLAARHFESARRPNFLIAETPDVDWRHPFFTCPITWRAIFKNYQSAGLSAKQQLLLEKREKPLTETLKPISAQMYGADQWVPVPPEPKYVLAKITLVKSLAGSLCELLYRTDPVFIDVSYKDGTFGYYRMLPVQAASGILMSCLPNSIAGFNELFSLAPRQRVTYFLIHGPGVKSFRKAIKVEFLEAYYR